MELLSSSPVSRDEHYAALAEAHFPRRKETLREDFDDRFESYWQNFLSDLEIIDTASSSKVSLRDMFAKHEDFTRRGLMRSAMDVFVSRQDHEDLSRIRLAIDEEAIDFEPKDIAFFRRWGEWEDIKRIDLMARGYRFAGGLGFSLLGQAASENSRVEGFERAANAIIKISGSRIEDVFYLDIQPRLLKQIVKLTPIKRFREISSDTLKSMIDHETEGMRKVLSLKMLIAFPKGWSSQFLSAYKNSDRYRYYNVIFWLDLCEAFDVRKFRSIATRELERLS